MTLKISKDEAAGYVCDILTGKLTPQQYKKSKEWYLDLGSIAVESSDSFADYTTEELARLAKEALEDFVVEDDDPDLVDPPRFNGHRKLTAEELARSHQLWLERKAAEQKERPDLPGSKDIDPSDTDDATPESEPTSDDEEYGVFFPDAESAAEFRRDREPRRHRGRRATSQRLKQESPTRPIRIISDAQLPEIELTKFTKNGGPLTKRLSLTSDGALLKDGSPCVMTRGTAERVKVTGTNALGALIEDLAPSQAIALGTLRADLPNRVGVTTKHKLVVNG